MKINKILFFIVFFPGISLDLLSLNIEKLKVEKGYEISIFAQDLDSPRQMAEGKDGTIFVAERGGQIIALYDSDKNGQADSKTILAKGLRSSTGLSLYEGDLYFSEISHIWKIENIEDWLADNMLMVGFPEKVLVKDDLPKDTWHGWKWLQHDQQGNLYLNVGAPCNICLSDNPQYASILRLKDDRWEHVAKGVRNSVGFAFHPESRKLFFTDNGRDWMGDDIPSCELNRVDLDGQFYGYPYKHASNILDPEFGGKNPGYDFIDPILELGAHVAPTGVAFYEGSMFPSEMKNNLLIALHGSWNSTERVGYKVVSVSLNSSGDVIHVRDFISGWLQDGRILGRPAAPFVLRDGSLLISDDKANVIYRVTYKK